MTNAKKQSKPKVKKNKGDFQKPNKQKKTP